jgi:hypothetical protein
VWVLWPLTGKPWFLRKPLKDFIEINFFVTKSLNFFKSLGNFIFDDSIIFISLYICSFDKFLIFKLAEKPNFLQIRAELTLPMPYICIKVKHIALFSGSSDSNK